MQLVNKKSIYNMPTTAVYVWYSLCDILYANLHTYDTCPTNECGFMYLPHQGLLTLLSAASHVTGPAMRRHTSKACLPAASAYLSCPYIDVCAGNHPPPPAAIIQVCTQPWHWVSACDRSCHWATNQGCPNGRVVRLFAKSKPDRWPFVHLHHHHSKRT